MSIKIRAIVKYFFQLIYCIFADNIFLCNLGSLERKENVLHNKIDHLWNIDTQTVCSAKITFHEIDF